MSKAFTREGDSFEDVLPEPATEKGVRNLITPSGLAKIQAELRHLGRVERPKVVETVSWAAGNGDRSENGDYIYGKKRLREIDKRIHCLTKRIEIAEPVDPRLQSATDQVFFGAVVTYQDGEGPTRMVRIVGTDETSHADGNISWVSPIARALMRAREGDVVEVRTPGGRASIEVVKIEYPSA
ncbi:MAG: transcription elongation factor GreB [Proteobacteria bacterium]|nr:transcription elongation factor GreB [Pseudomonadota bacterium]